MPIEQAVVPFVGCFAAGPEKQDTATLVFAGLPDDSQSSFRRGSAHGPRRIRSAYDGNCYHATTEAGVDLTSMVADLGDVPSQNSWNSTARSYQELAAKLFRSGKIPFFAGGDHAVTVPVIAALAEIGEPVHIVQIDAHPDLYPEFEGNRDSHACTITRALEMRHVASVTQLGVRTLNAAQMPQLERYHDRLNIFFARDLLGELPMLSHIPNGAPVYLTVDLDGFDPAYAPGVSHPVPGGLTPRQVLTFMQKAHWKLVGMDAVEVNPDLDVNDQTAILAARLLHEGMGYAARQVLL
ncbi:MAG: agmatinase [candidate division KSB1 bacterium]|nr:agmatinase [candidate division KSB1 bacterium]MDZ7369101.1 agmatinase [candidate division KSB1 bacterium]MDZ7407062.1 agmatinase [candidate division KSB1 bacterium]